MPADQEPAGVRPARAAEPEQPEVIPHAIWEPGAASDPDETAQFPALKRRLPFIRAGAAARQDPAAPIPADDEDTNAPPELTEARR